MSKQKLRWGGIFFLLSTAVVGFVIGPIYFWRFGISWVEISLFMFYFIATMMAITVGYHRLYAHVAFKAHPILQFFILIFGAAAFEQSALRWASLHRTHHRYVDTKDDPYNIKRGFFYAHMGWLIFNKPQIDYDNALDLQKIRLVQWQHQHHQALGLVMGIGLPLAIGLMTGHVWGVLFLAVGARLALVHHSTFFINSFAHSFGTAEYDSESSAKDNWFGAVLTNGEGYHNFHHRFPSDYRNGVLWYHWDPTKWVIWLLSKTRLIWDLRRTSPAAISEAKASARAHG